jgi:hypothetical protein
MSREPQGLLLYCLHCKKEITEPEMYFFEGWVACEQCVRDWYRDKPAEQLDLQLQKRHQQAATWVVRWRKDIEKVMARRQRHRSQK